MSKTNFTGTINGRVYSDEKVFQYALKDALAKGEDIEVTATSTTSPDDPQPVPPVKQCNGDFRIAIDPDKIAANLECANDREEFLDNLRNGMKAVVSEFTDALAENKINTASADSALAKEVDKICSKMRDIASNANRLKNSIDKKSSLIEEAKTEKADLENKLDYTNSLYQAMRNLADSYLEMRKNLPRTDPFKAVMNDSSKDAKGQLESLLADFLNLFK